METVIICDDNVSFCDLVERRIRKREKDLNIDVVKFYDANQLRGYCRDHKFDILFLDIKIGEEDGFEIANYLKERNPKCLIIYISFYDEYYMDIVRAKPFRFIYKDLSDLQMFEDELDSVLSAAVRRLTCQSLFAFKVNGMQYTVDLPEIAYFYSSAHTLHICGETGSAPHYYYGEIDDLEYSLKKISKDFVRVNKKYIINVKFVQQIKSNRRIIVNGKSITLTPHYRDNFVKIYSTVKIRPPV